MKTPMEVIIEKYYHKISCRTAGDELSIFHSKIYYDTALKHAILSIDKNGKKFSHQRRIRNDALENSYKMIVKEKIQLYTVENFEQIFSIIENNKKPGFGRLCCYDSALRIAEYRNIPIKHIYLQAGSLAGAKNLFSVYNKKLILISDRFINKSDLPEPLLKEMEEKVIENFLCVMKDEILLIKQ
jgi:hypothetical protein